MLVRRAAGSLLLLVASAACSSGEDQDATVTSRSDATVPSASPTLTLPPVSSPSTPPAAESTSAPATTSGSTSSSTTMTTAAATTAAATTTAATTTTVSGIAGVTMDALQTLEIGRSVEGRPIVAVQRGTPGGVVVVVIGVIHGNEDDGVAIVERLATAPVPEGVDLWLVESMNPDGQAAGQRGNANAVDLNRNFPYNWDLIGAPGDPQYAGPAAASEPETQAVVDFVSRIQPALGLWYHQDLFRLSPGEGLEGRLKERYSELTGLPILRITGGTYTGVAATWQRNTVDDGISFIVELGPTVSAGDADRHALAVLALAEMIRDAG